jgi:hypothetical protein
MKGKGAIGVVFSTAWFPLFLRQMMQKDHFPLLLESLNKRYV